MMRDVIFWGGTGQAKVINEAIDNSKYRLVAIVDNQKLKNSPITSIPLLHGMNGLNKWMKIRAKKKIKAPSAVITIGGSKGSDRLELMQKLKKMKINILNVIHNRAFVAKDAKLGSGIQILAMAAICSRVKIGNGVIINTSALIDHDCIINDGVHIGPGAKLAGEVKVSKFVFVGTGAIILPRVQIGKYAIIGAGAVVTKNVLPFTTVVGNPARVI